MSTANINNNDNPERREATDCFMQARTALKNADFNNAERLLKRALKLWPDNFNYTLQMAKLAIQVNKQEKEIEDWLQQSSRLNLMATEPRLLLATQYEKTGQAHRAISIYKGVLNIDPNNLIVRRKLGQLDIDLGTSMTMDTLEMQSLSAREGRSPTQPLKAPPPIQAPPPVIPKPSTQKIDLLAPSLSGSSMPAPSNPTPVVAAPPLPAPSTAQTSSPVQAPPPMQSPAMQTPPAKIMPPESAQTPPPVPLEVPVSLEIDTEPPTPVAVNNAVEESENSWQSLMDAIQHDSQMFEVDGSLPLNVGISYMEIGLFQEAVEEFNDAWRLFQAKGDKEQSIRCCQMLADALISQELFDEAAEWCTQGLSLAVRTSEEGQYFITQLASIYEWQGNVQAAADLRADLAPTAIDERDLRYSTQDGNLETVIANMTMGLRLVRGLSGDDIPLNGNSVELYIGRGPRNDIDIDSPRVSKEHALLRFTSTGLVVVGISKTNGTYLNGEKLEPDLEYLLQVNDIIGLGKTIDLQVISLSN